MAILKIFTTLAWASLFVLVWLTVFGLVDTKLAENAAFVFGLIGTLGAMVWIDSE